MPGVPFPMFTIAVPSSGKFVFPDYKVHFHLPRSLFRVSSFPDHLSIYQFIFPKTDLKKNTPVPVTSLGQSIHPHLLANLFKEQELSFLPISFLEQYIQLCFSGHVTVQLNILQNFPIFYLPSRAFQNPYDTCLNLCYAHHCKCLYR